MTTDGNGTSEFRYLVDEVVADFLVLRVLRVGPFGERVLLAGQRTIELLVELEVELFPVFVGLAARGNRLRNAERRLSRPTGSPILDDDLGRACRGRRV